jgi:O-antigen/teichoic acid export membrane protein
MKNSLFAVASTVFSGVGNVLVQLVLAALLGTSDFGRFTLASSSIIFVLGAGRALIGQTDMLRGSAGPDLRPAGAAYVLSAVLALAGIVVALAGLTDSMGTTSLIGIAIAVSSIFVLQDASRFRAFRVRRAWVAATSDLLSLILVFGGLAIVSRIGMTATAAIAIWSVATAVGFLVVVRPLSYFPSPRAGVTWLIGNRDLVLPSAGEFVLQAGLPYLLNWVLVGLGGFGALAGYRLIQLLFAGVANIAQGINSASLPRIVDSRSPTLARRLAGIEVALLSTISLSVFLVLWLSPQSWGMAVFGNTWTQLGPFLVAGSIHGLVNALAVPNYSLLRLLGHARFSFVVRLWTVALSIGAVAVGVALIGPPGLAWGMATVAAAAYCVRVARSRSALSSAIRNSKMIGLDQRPTA